MIFAERDSRSCSTSAGFRVAVCCLNTMLDYEHRMFKPCAAADNCCAGVNFEDCPANQSRPNFSMSRPCSLDRRNLIPTGAFVGRTESCADSSSPTGTTVRATVSRRFRCPQLFLCVSADGPALTSSRRWMGEHIKNNLRLRPAAHRHAGDGSSPESVSVTRF
jgi:hypothetical protein